MRIAHGLFAVLMTGVLSACTSPVGATSTADQPQPPTSTAAVTSAPKVGVYTDPQGRFSLVPPSGWKADENGPPGTEVIFVRPAAAHGSFHPNVNVVVVPSDGDLDATVVASRKELGALNRFRSFIDVAFTLADGKPGHLLGGTFTANPVTFPLRNELAVTVAGGRTVVVTATAPAQDWSSVATTFTVVLRSLTVSG